MNNANTPAQPCLTDAQGRSFATNALQSIWTLLDECGISRRNRTSPQTHLSIYGRVYSAIQDGSLLY